MGINGDNSVRPTQTTTTPARTIGTGPTAQPQETTGRTGPMSQGEFQAAGARSRDRLPETGGLMGWIQRTFGLGGFSRQGSDSNSVSGLTGISGSNRSSAAAAQPAGVGATPGVGAATSTGAVSYQDLATSVNANTRLDYLEIERGNVNRGISEHLKGLANQLNSQPGLRDKLAATEVGRELLATLDKTTKQPPEPLGTDDILALQKFTVASGENIGTASSPQGIDGQYGPKTHQGLMNAINNFAQNPDMSLAAITAGTSRAAEGVRSFNQNGPDGVAQRYVPGQSPALRDASGTPPQLTVDRPAGITPPAGPPGAIGSSLLSASDRIVPQMAAKAAAEGRRNVGRCMEGVRRTIDEAGIRSDSGAANFPRTGSAYKAADVLATQYRNTFTEKTPATAEDLRNLPAGAIVVWDRNPDPSKRAANPNNGFSHGHIEIADGRGRARSDFSQNSVTMPGGGRYGGFRVFLPNA